MKFKNYMLVLFLSLFSIQIFAQADVEVETGLIITQADTLYETNTLLARNAQGALVSVKSSFINQVEEPKPIPYNSNWEDYGANYKEGTYYKHGDRVFLDGLIEKTNGNIVNLDVIFYLPEGYRPRKHIIAIARRNDSPLRLNIAPDGKVWVVEGADVGQAPSDWMGLDGISFYRKELKIGDTHEGGIVFYLPETPEDIDGDGDLDYGMVVAPMDQADAIWGCTGTAITGADDIHIGSGYQNTIDILSECTEADIAAKICDDLILNGYDDWFLPSYDALDEMYTQIGLGASGLNHNIGGFTTTPIPIYLSSAEYNIVSDILVRHISMDSGNGSFSLKTNVRHVRAVRVF